MIVKRLRPAKVLNPIWEVEVSTKKSKTMNKKPAVISAIQKAFENRLKTLKISGFKFSFTNIREFHILYKDIFWSKEYDFYSQKKRPFIIDCGSHIGISVLFFKKKYPDAYVVAFEPSQTNFRILDRNVKQNGLKGVKLVNAAVTEKNGIAKFFVSKKANKVFTRNLSVWSWSNFVEGATNNDINEYEAIKVPSVRLSPFIKREVDLLKIDIEGMEGKVIEEIKNKLYLVKEIIMEFHNDTVDGPKKLKKILMTLEKYSFNYKLAQMQNVIDNKLIRKNLPASFLIKATNTNYLEN